MNVALPVPAPVSLHVTDAVIGIYADAADDHNPIHLDDEAGRAIGMPGRIAHGMLSGALLLRMLEEGFGEAWWLRGRVELTFVRPLLPGRTVTARAQRDGERLEVWVETDEPGHPRVIVGTAWLEPAPSPADQPLGN